MVVTEEVSVISRSTVDLYGIHGLTFSLKFSFWESAVQWSVVNILNFHSATFKWT